MLLTNSLRKCIEISVESWYVYIGLKVLWNLNQWRIIEGFPVFACDKQIEPFFQETLQLHLIQINNLEYQEERADRTALSFHEMLHVLLIDWLIDWLINYQ